jgi:hypothetical protein
VKKAEKKPLFWDLGRCPTGDVIPSVSSQRAFSIPNITTKV